MPRPYCAIIVFAFACLGLASAGFAQATDANRILRMMDFEERRLNNPEDLPMHWIKLQGTGLPHYVNGKLSSDKARSGKYSFRFDLNGGSLIYRYEPGQIRVQPGAHYRVESFVSTTVLANARARMTAYFTDLDQHPILSTIRHSELYSAKAPDEDWHRLSIQLSPNSKEAAFLVVELELLQSSLYSPTTLGDRALFDQDINGTAWFDDVTISQVPKVTLATDRPGNIFRRGEALRLSVVVNDRFTDDLAARLVICDAWNKQVYQRSGALDMASAEDLGPGRKRMPLDLPDLRPGWYEATLVMSSHGQFVGQQSLDMVLLSDTAPRVAPDARFGIIATDLPYDGWGELPRILPFLGAGRVKLAVWSAAGDVEQADPIAFDSLLERLGELGITPTACLVDLPPAVARRVNGSSWLQLLKANPELWRGDLAYLIARHANHLDRWQLGADNTDAFVTQPQMREVYHKVYSEFANLVDKPDLAMPWPAWYELEGELPATVAMSVPSSVLPSQIPLYMQDVVGEEATKRRSDGATEGNTQPSSPSSLRRSVAPSLSSSHYLSLSLQLLDRAQYGRDMQIRDLSQRMVYALAAGASRIDVPLPFTVQRDGDTIENQPQELLMIVRTLITTLGGATYQGKVPLADGVEAFLFDKSGQGILVLWSQGSETDVKKLEVNLGDRPIRLDLWGNATPLFVADGVPGGKNPSASSQHAVQLDLGPMPIFLLDIDGQMAQMRASVALDRPLIESSFMPHTRHIRFSNPSRTSITGAVKLKAPVGWTLNPPTYTFSLNPNETFDRELTLELPYNTLAGPKTINAEFRVSGERGESTFMVPIVLNVGLSDVGMQSLALRDKNDVIVQQMITNYGERPIDYTAFALYPGQARQERLVMNLGPGRTTIKLYRFTNVKFAKDGKVRSGLKELQGTRILNDEVPIQ